MKKMEEIPTCRDFLHYIQRFDLTSAVNCIRDCRKNPVVGVKQVAEAIVLGAAL